MNKSDIIKAAEEAAEYLETSNMESDIYLEALVCAAKLLKRVEVLSSCPICRGTTGIKHPQPPVIIEKGGV